MTTIERTLPFPRGTTMSDGETSTPADGNFSHLVGRRYAVHDELHKGGEDVILRVVQNDSGDDLTLYRRCVSFSTGSETEFGAKIDGYAGTGGEICKPVDDYYRGRLTTCPSNDLMYVVDEGRCDILTTADCSLEAYNEPVQMVGFGKIDGASAADVVLGHTMERCSNTAASTAVCVYVHGGIYGGGTS
jgi:hypothetical protein